MFEEVTNATQITPIGWAVVFGVGLGLASAAHCAGMCGGFPIMIVGGGKSKGAKLKRLIAYNFGRGTTYILLGTIAALIGASMGRALDSAVTDGTLLIIGKVLTVVLGAVLMLSGLFLLGVRLPFAKEGHRGFISELVAKSGRSLFANKSSRAALLVGALNGLLPCPLVYAMLSSVFYLGAMVSWQSGSMASVGFALGTMPIMFLIGLVGGALTMERRRSLAKFAGVGLLLFGAVTVARGVVLEQMHNLLPMDHVHNDQIGAGDLLFDRVQSVRIVIPEGMDVGDWKRLMAHEHRLQEERVVAINAGIEALRAYDLDLSSFDHERGTHQLFAFTLTEENLAALQAQYDREKVFTYRCSCCGTPREAALKFFQAYDVLLFPEGELPKD